ncbi:GntR family transcriptional regulator [Streptomyces sp. NPDC020817]|uniref:GntR family transcriptional regulator n=1 Tax=Streptomyces sp. NPDC020817 TaxID=3365095 RepID=UPI0037B0A347
MVRDLSGLPPYRRIAEQIIERIRAGQLSAGDRVPSVAEIMRDENVSRATAARVPGVLRAEGWADAIPGVGTIVRQPKQMTAGADRLQLLRSGGSGLRDNEQVEILKCEMQPATQEVADALGLEVGDQVAIRQRRYIDDKGVSVVSATWISAAVAEAAPEFLEAEPLPKMTFGLIEDRTGRRASRRRDTVSQKPAPDDIAPLLEVDAGTLTLVMANHYWDQNGEPTEYAVDYYGTGRQLSAEYDLG